jgi:hypothetical protein
MRHIRLLIPRKHVVRIAHHRSTTFLLLERFDLVNFTEDAVHVLEADTLCFRPEKHDHDQPDQIDADEDPVGVVADIFEHDGPRLVDPERRHLLPGLRNVDPFVAEVGREDLTGVNPSARPEGAAIGLERRVSVRYNWKWGITSALTISIT